MDNMWDLFQRDKIVGYRVHPAARRTVPPTVLQYQYLFDDIDRLGRVLTPLVLIKVGDELFLLDGRSRGLCVEELNKKRRLSNAPPIKVEFQTIDQAYLDERGLTAEQFSDAANLARRQSNEPQSLLTAALRKDELLRTRTAGDGNGKSRAIAAQGTGYSDRQIDKAYHIIQSGIGTLLDAVNSGHLAIDPASKLARALKEETLCQKLLIDELRKAIQHASVLFRGEHGELSKEQIGSDPCLAAAFDEIARRTHREAVGRLLPAKAASSSHRNGKKPRKQLTDAVGVTVPPQHRRRFDDSVLARQLTKQMSAIASGMRKISATLPGLEPTQKLNGYRLSIADACDALIEALAEHSRIWLCPACAGKRIHDVCPICDAQGYFTDEARYHAGKSRWAKLRRTKKQTKKVTSKNGRTAASRQQPTRKDD